MTYIYSIIILQDIRKFLDGAENGAIAISLGTNVKWKSFEEDKLKIVALALSKLKQRVLWKLDIDVPFQMPDNVMAVKWMPQDKVLSTFLDIIYRYHKCARFI